MRSFLVGESWLLHGSVPPPTLLLPFALTSIKLPSSSSAQCATECSISSFLAFLLGSPTMDRLLPILSFLFLSAAASHAALPAEVYWNTVLPKTPMPNAIRELLRPDALVDEKAGTSVSVGKGGVNVNTGKGKPGGTTVDVGHKGVGVNVHSGQGGTHVSVGGGGGVNVNTGKGKPGGGTNVNVGHGGVNVHTGYKGKPVVVNVRPFIYNYAATETQIHYDPRVALFFLEKDLHPGAKMTLRFTTTAHGGAAFLPQRAAERIPFSSKRLPEVLAHFSIEPSSVEAEAMKQTLNECEAPAAEGERRYCATSLESMVDFSMSALGTRSIAAVSTAVVGQDGEREQKYTVAPGGVRRMAGSELVACHAEAYAYAVFYCHSTRATRAYTVKMVGENRAAVEAVAVCHTDTAGWNPEHVAFKVLKVKPGTVPVCHFLPQDNIVWAPTK